jgi:hypothetical protein
MSLEEVCAEGDDDLVQACGYVQMFSSEWSMYATGSAHFHHDSLKINQ